MDENLIIMLISQIINEQNAKIESINKEIVNLTNEKSVIEEEINKTKTNLEYQDGNFNYAKNTSLESDMEKINTEIQEKNNEIKAIKIELSKINKDIGETFKER